MKQLILLAIAVVLLSSCTKQRSCTCSTVGSAPHEILGYSPTECSAYEALVPDRVCTYEQ
jgi:hypothetical protein